MQLLLVDDAQHLDPQAARLVRVLSAGAEPTVIAGDPNQTVFGYRGADPALLRGDEPAITLTAVAPVRARRSRDVITADRAPAARAPTRPATLAGTDAAGLGRGADRRVASTPNRR